MNERKLGKLYQEITKDFDTAANLPGFFGPIASIILNNPFNMDAPQVTREDRALLNLLRPIFTSSAARAILDTTTESLHGQLFQKRFIDYYSEAVKEINQSVN